MQENPKVVELRETLNKNIEELKSNMGAHAEKFKEKNPETYELFAKNAENLKSTTTKIVSDIESLADSDEVKPLKDAANKFIADIQNLFSGAKESEKKD